MNKSIRPTIALIISIFTLGCNNNFNELQLKDNILQNNFKSVQGNSKSEINTQKNYGTLTFSMNNLINNKKGAFIIKGFNFSNIRTDVRKLRLSVTGSNINTPVTQTIDFKRLETDFIDNMNNARFSFSVLAGNNRIVSFSTLDKFGNVLSTLMGATNIIAGQNNNVDISFIDTTTAQILLNVLNSNNPSLIENIKLSDLKNFVLNATGYKSTNNSYNKIIDPKAVSDFIINNSGKLPSSALADGYGILNVNMNITGATLRLNDLSSSQIISTTNNTVINAITPGIWTLTMIRDGYRTKSQQVTISSNTATPVSASMDEKVATITTIAGGGSGSLTEGISANKAQLGNLKEIAGDTDGNILFTDPANHKIRKIDVNGIITTVAGTGKAGFSGDSGLAVNAQIDSPQGITVDYDNNIYFIDSLRIRKINTSGIITTLVGNGMPDTTNLLKDAFNENSEDFLLSSGTSAIAANRSFEQFAGQSTIYFSDTFYNRIAFLWRGFGNNVVTPLVGSSKSDPGNSAQVNNPQGIDTDSFGNIYFCDTGNYRIRMAVSSDSTPTTFAGKGTQGYSGDGGLAINARFNNPVRLAVTSAGGVFISDSTGVIRKVDANGIISTVAGNGTPGFSGDDGKSKDALLNNPQGIAVDNQDNLLIVDSGNNRIRKITFQ